jgi:hypothetical protein
MLPPRLRKPSTGSQDGRRHFGGTLSNAPVPATTLPPAGHSPSGCAPKKGREIECHQTGDANNTVSLNDLRQARKPDLDSANPVCGDIYAQEFQCPLSEFGFQYNKPLPLV